MLSTSDPLAIKQTFSRLDIETRAWAKLDQVATAFYNKELTNSTELFLESWHILQNEYESSLYKWLDSLPKKA